MKKDTYYFSHDYNAHNDTKILYMRQDLGMEGYGIYWFLVESLADSGGILPLRILPVLSKQMDVSLAKLETIINQYELFQIIDGQFFSERLTKHLELRNGLSEAGKLGAEVRWGIHKNGGAIGHPNAKERKGKEKKVKEIKESTPSENSSLKNSNLFRQPNIPTFEEVNQAFKNNGGTEEMAKLFFDKYSGVGWFNRGNPITNFRYFVSSFITNFNKFNNGTNQSSNKSNNKSISSVASANFEALRNWADQFSDEDPNSNAK
jgi:hypothetical protein